MSLRHYQSGGILLSCRAPGYQGSWPQVAATPNGDGLFPGWLHCDRPMVALLHAGRAAVLMCTSPCYPGAGRKCWLVFPPPRLRPVTFHRPVSLELIICTGLNLVHPGPAITHFACLHGSRDVIGVGLLSLPSSCAGHTGASCRGLCFLLETWWDSLGVV